MTRGQTHTSCLKQIFNLCIMYVTKTEIPVHFNPFTGNIFKYKNICDAAKWFYCYYSLPNTWVLTEEKFD